MSDTNQVSTAVIDSETGEILEGYTPEITNRAASGVRINGVTYETVQAVSIPILTHVPGRTVAVRIESPMRVEVQRRKEMATVDGVEKEVEKTNKIHVMRVIELGSGILMQYVCNAITASDLDNTYPNETYVGKSFAIQKLGRVAGKLYNEINIVEIRPRAPEAS